MRTVVSPKKHGVSAIAVVVSSYYNYYCMWTCYNKKILSQRRRETCRGDILSLQKTAVYRHQKGTRGQNNILYYCKYNLVIYCIRVRFTFGCEWYQREKITILHDISRYLWVSCTLATLSYVRACCRCACMNRVRGRTTRF